MRLDRGIIGKTPIALQRHRASRHAKGATKKRP